MDKSLKDMNELKTDIDELKTEISRFKNTAIATQNATVIAQTAAIAAQSAAIAAQSAATVADNKAIAANDRTIILSRIIDEVEDDVSLLDDNEKAKLLVKICCKYISEYIVPYLEMYNNPKLQKLYSQKGYRRALPDENFWEDQKILGKYLLKYFGESVIDQTILTPAVGTEYQCSLKVAQMLMLSSQSLQNLDFGGMFHFNGISPSSLFQGYAIGNENDQDKTNRILKVINNYPLSTINEEMIMINVLESIIDNIDYYLKSYKKYATDGICPHVIEWYPELYCSSIGATGTPINKTPKNLIPKFACVQPPIGTFSKWEPYNGRIEDINNWNETRSKEILLVLEIYKKLRDKTIFMKHFKSEYVDVRNRLKATCDNYVAYFQSPEFLNKMEYTNKPGIYSQIKNLNTKTEEEKKIIANSLCNTGLLSQTTYYNNDPVWTVIKKSNPESLNLSDSDKVNIDKIFKNFDFKQDTTNRPVCEKLYDLGIGTSKLYK